MNACTDATHAGLPKPPLLIPFRAPRTTRWHPFLVLLAAAASASSAASSTVPAQPVVHTEETGSATQAGDCHSLTQTRASAVPWQKQRNKLLQPGLEESEPWTAVDRAPAGNSFIMLGAPVHKATPLPPNLEDADDTAPVQSSISSHDQVTVEALQLQNAAQDLKESGDAVRDAINATSSSSIDRGPSLTGLPEHRAVWDGVGMRVAHLWSKTLGNLTSTSPPAKGTRTWWLEVLLFHSVACLMALVTSVLLVYVAYDVIRNWSHRVTLRSVRAKVRRTNEFFSGLHTESSLCLCCVEFIPSSSPSTVTFLCGHSFHMRCANEWYKRHSHNAEQADSSTCPGRCPICAGQWGLSSLGEEPTAHNVSAPEAPKTTAEETEETEETGTCSAPAPPGGSASDCARLFALHCLCERYPGIITKDDFERLAAQPTAVLLSEIQFARQAQRKRLHSIFG